VHGAKVGKARKSNSPQKQKFVEECGEIFFLCGWDLPEKITFFWLEIYIRPSHRIWVNWGNNASGEYKLATIS
jgi:hypothetical protein